MNKWILIVTLGLASLTTTSVFAASKRKMSQGTAKKECLKENSDLKGKALQKCISKKRK